MPDTCANRLCSAAHHQDEGKLFRFDFEIANQAGGIQHEITFIWLCSRCSQQLNPRIEITGDKVRVLLATVQAKSSVETSAWVN